MASTVPPEHLTNVSQVYWLLSQLKEALSLLPTDLAAEFTAFAAETLGVPPPAPGPGTKPRRDRERDLAAVRRLLADLGRPVTLTELSTLFGIGRQGVYQLIVRGNLPGLVKVGEAPGPRTRGFQAGLYDFRDPAPLGGDAREEV